VTDAVPPAARGAKTRQLLAGLHQGDLLSLGAVSVVGRGPTAALASAGVAAPAEDALWSLTVDSEVGWYVVLSGPCDIVRDPSVEPCLTVCPVTLVDADRYRVLRHGGYSPREFPLPLEKLKVACGRGRAEDFFPVADQRYVASIDKTALEHPSVQTLRPLTGPQQQRLAAWAGRRYARAAHPDAVEEHVLKKIAPLIARSASKGGALAAGKRTLQQKLVCATDTWLVSSTEQSVTFYPVLTEALAKATGLFNSATSSIDAGQVKAAVKLLTGDALAAITSDGNFRIKFVPTTWDAMTAAEYLDRPEWQWENDPDPLA
jgi:hypothetical protein